MATSAGELIYTVGMDISGAVNNGNRASQAFNGLERSAATLNTTLSRTYSIAMSVAGALAVDRIIKYADAWTIAGNKITNYLKDGQNLVDVQNAIFKAARDTRTPLAAVASLYARLEPATRGIVTSGEEMIKITETINKAFVVSGATGEEAAASIIQLGQALGAGALRSEEFNSVNEQAPRIMQGIADSLGVTSGELKGLAAQGKLTTEVVINAIRVMASSVDVEFAKMNQTFEQKGTVALNNLTKSLGTNADAQKAVAKIGDAMVSLSENIDTAVVAGEALATVYGAKLVGAMANSTAAMVKNAVANHAASIASLDMARANEANAAAALTAARNTIVNEKATQAQAAAERAGLATAQASLTAQLSLARTERERTAIRLQLLSYSNAMIAAAARENAAIAAQATAAGVATTRMATLAAAQAAVGVAARAASVAIGVMRGALALVGGPAGIAFLAAAGIYYLITSMDNGSKSAIDYAGSIDTVTAALSKMNKEQLGAEQVRIGRQISEQNLATANSTQELIKKEQYLAYLRKSGASAESIKKQEQEIALARGAAADSQQKLNQYLEAQAAINSKLNEQSKKADTKTTKPAGVSSGAQKILDDLKARTEAEKAYGTAQSARVMAEKEARESGVTDPKEIQMISDAAAALFEQTKNRKENTKATNADNTAAEQNAQTINDAKLKTQQLTVELSNLKNGTEEITGATSRYSIESATLAAQQQLNKDATKQQVSALAEQILAQQRVNEAIAKGKKEQENKKKVTTEFETVEKTTFTAGESVDAKYQADLKALKDYHKLAGAENSRYEKAKARLERQYEKDKRQALEDDYKAQSEGHAFVMDSLDALGNASTNAISGLLSGTMSVTEAMQSFANIILNQAVGALVEIGIQQVKNQILGQTAAAASVAAAAAQGTAIAAAYAPAAISANIATFGAAGTAGLAGYQAALSSGTLLAVAGARQFGGPTDAGMYRVGENNQPEIYQSGGASYLISGDRGRVTPMSEAGSGSGFQQTVNVHNNSGANVSTRTSPDGKQMDVIINEISSQLENRRGRFARAMTSGTNTKFKAR